MALAAAAVAGSAPWLSPLGGKAKPRPNRSADHLSRHSSRRRGATGSGPRRRKEAAADKDKAEQERKQREKTALKQETLQRPLNARSADATAIDTYRAPQGYELRLTGVTITVAGPSRGSSQLSAHHGALATGGMAEPHQQTWKDSPYVVPEGKRITLSVDCVPEATGTHRLPPSPNPSADTVPPATPSACIATAPLNGMLVPTKGPFASPLPHPIA